MGNQIFYDKTKKFRTPDKSLLNLVLTTIGHAETPVYSNSLNSEALEHQFNQLLTGVSNIWEPNKSFCYTGRTKLKHISLYKLSKELEVLKDVLVGIDDYQTYIKENGI